MPLRWGYGTDNGPGRWHIDYPVAKEGCRQSPIDIQTSSVEKDTSLMESPLEWKYSPEQVLHIENTGQSWTVKVDGSGSSLKGGPLQDEYELWQFHAHWGSDNEHGSEHTVDGRNYPAELHLVHWNRTKYNSPGEAAAQPDGLAVLGIFLELSNTPHAELAKVCNLMDKVTFKDQKASFNEPVDITKFLPADINDMLFWTYDGSLTTPPLLESVTWIVFKKTLKVSEEQLESMRSLMFCNEETNESDGPEKMVNNYRPTCPLSGRKVREC